MDETHDPDIYVTYSFDISIIRLIENIFIPSQISICASIEKGEEDVENTAVEAALNRCKYWFDQVVSRCIAFDYQNAVAYQMLIDDEGANRSANLFLLTPGDPSDETLGAVFQAKMNALGDNAIVISSIDVKSDNLVGLSFTLTGNHGVTLPQTMDEWVGSPTFFDVPWWNRCDASTLDVIPPDGTDLDEKPGWAYSLDFIGRPARTTIGRPEFKPTVIDGGKNPPTK